MEVRATVCSSSQPRSPQQTYITSQQSCNKSRSLQVPGLAFFLRGLSPRGDCFVAQLALSHRRRVTQGSCFCLVGPSRSRSNASTVGGIFQSFVDFPPLIPLLPPQPTIYPWTPGRGHRPVWLLASSPSNPRPSDQTVTPLRHLRQASVTPASQR